MEANELLPQFIEFTALVYHEGRHVSRLFHLNAASRKTFGQIAELPPDQAKAWDKLIPVQKESAAAQSAKDAAQTFHNQYGCSLDELAALFENPAWRRVPGCGGAPWAAIARATMSMRDAIDRKDEKDAARLAEEIPAMRHNTGTVKDKLARLKARPR